MSTKNKKEPPKEVSPAASPRGTSFIGNQRISFSHEDEFKTTKPLELWKLVQNENKVETPSQYGPLPSFSESNTIPIPRRFVDAAQKKLVIPTPYQGIPTIPASSTQVIPPNPRMKVMIRHSFIFQF